MTSDYAFKLIMLGASKVGKTSIVQRFCNDIFEGPGHKTTLGFDFITKKLEYNGKHVDLEVWDTAGQEEYKAVTKMYYKDVHGVILVYDTTDKASFEKTKFWLDDLDMHGSKLEQRLLVGSKMDLGSQRQVTLYEAKKFAAERKLEWTECSAKTGEAVKDVFNLLIDKMIVSFNTNPDYKKLFSRSTLITVGPAISEADASHRSQGYKLNKEKVGKKGCC